MLIKKMVPLYYLYLGFSKENLCALGDDYGECIVQEIALNKSILWENGPLQSLQTTVGFGLERLQSLFKTAIITL